MILLVTGASRGIGAATALLAAARGYAVAVNYRSKHAAADRVVAGIEQSGGRAMAIRPMCRWKPTYAVSSKRSIAASAWSPRS